MRLLSLILAALLLLSGCGDAKIGQTPPGADGETPTNGAKLPASYPTDPESPIFQVFPKGGFVPGIYRRAEAPELTLLADGRLITLERVENGARRFFVRQIPKEQLAELYAKVRKAMDGVSGEYAAGTWTDDRTTHFRFWTPDGVQKGEVYGFNSEPQEHENRLAKVDQLRTARRLILEVAGTERKPYVANSVKLVVELWESPSDWPVTQWPADLPALPQPTLADRVAQQSFTGEVAGAIVATIPYEVRAVYKSSEGYFNVMAVPAIPLMP